MKIKRKTILWIVGISLLVYSLAALFFPDRAETVANGFGIMFRGFLLMFGV